MGLCLLKGKLSILRGSSGAPGSLHVITLSTVTLQFPSPVLTLCTPTAPGPLRCITPVLVPRKCQANVSLSFSLLTVLWTIKPTLDESHHSLCFCHVTLVRDNERCACHSLAPLPMQSTIGYQNKPEGELIICVQEASAPLPFLLLLIQKASPDGKTKSPGSPRWAPAAH